MIESLGKSINTSNDNNLNLIRLLLALSVIFSHSYPLSAGLFDPLMIFSNQQQSIGNVAVDLFFFISGILITASWFHSPSMQNFLMKRVLRIYPGYIASMIFSAVIVFAFCADFRVHVGHGISWFFQFLNDCIFLKTNSLGKNWIGIFSSNPYPCFANGSLWTISFEFQCYLIVAVIGLFSFFKHRKVILLLSLLCFITYVMAIFHGKDTNMSLLRCLAFFLTGVLVWLWRDKIPLSPWLAFGSVSALLIACCFRPWLTICLPIFGGYCILWLGYSCTIPWMSWTRRVDLSYGVYLYAYPIQQVISLNPLLRHHLVNFMIAVPVSLVLAWLSWTFLEKRFLAIKHVHFRDFDPGDKVCTDEIKPVHP